MRKVCVGDGVLFVTESGGSGNFDVVMVIVRTTHMITEKRHALG